MDFAMKVGTESTGMKTIPVPSEMTVSLQDIDASTTTRTADGTIHRDRICGGATAKRKIELMWKYLDHVQVKNILQAFKDTFCFVQYFDPYEGDWRTAEFYTGDRTAPMYSCWLDSDSVLWESVHFDLIEK